MSRVVGLYHSSVGKKVLMAVTGIVLWGYVLLHMLGNLKVFFGQDKFNEYSEFLRLVGAPAVPHGGALWVVRAVLLVAVVVHVLAAWQLYRMSGRAREVSYRKQEDLSFSYASKTMRWGGVIIALFVVYHILHLTTGDAHASFTPGDPYGNLVSGFQRPLVAGAYIVAMAALALHLHHGLWSLMQTMGWNHARYNRYRRPFAVGVAWAIFLGFVSVPVAVLLGWVR